MKMKKKRREEMLETYKKKAKQNRIIIISVVPSELYIILLSMSIALDSRLLHLAVCMCVLFYDSTHRWYAWARLFAHKPPPTMQNIENCNAFIGYINNSLPHIVHNILWIICVRRCIVLNENGASFSRFACVCVCAVV